VCPAGGENVATAKRDCLSVYFKNRDVIDRLKKLSKSTGKSVSGIIDAVMTAALPTLEVKAPKSRQFDVKCEVRI
jgi:hypothetical protein